MSYGSSAVQLANLRLGPEACRRPLVERFWEKVERRGPWDCWPWLAGKYPSGYGQIWVEGKNELAHRVAYRLSIGPIPPGLTIDHVKARGCVRRDCCNPAHLEPVSRGENVLRGDGLTAQNARKTRCPAGHAYTQIKHCRYCRTCAAMRRAGQALVGVEAGE
jgi:hypothetical protein